jgi:spore germination protein YaaH
MQTGAGLPNGPRKVNPALSGWSVWWNPKSLESFRANANRISVVMPEWIKVDADGTVIRRDNVPPAYKKDILKISKKNGVKVYAMTSNYGDGGFDPIRMAKSMATPEIRLAHAEALAKIAREDKLDGIDLDYENMKAGDRENFSLLVEAIAKALRRDKKRLSVTVHAKQSEPGNWDAVIAHDWKRLAAVADEFRVMTYDEHWAGGEPGPVASNAWVEATMKFAVTQVPANKLWMGVSTYGYDFSKTPTPSLTFADLPADFKYEIDPTSGEMQAGKIWFAGPESAQRKREIAKKFRIAGLAIWYIGSEKPSTWGVLTGDFE